MNGINNWPNRTGAEDYENKTVQGAFDFRVGTTYAAPSHASAVHGDDTPLEKGLKYSTEQFRTAGENAHPSRLPERAQDMLLRAGGNTPPGGGGGTLCPSGTCSALMMSRTFNKLQLCWMLIILCAWSTACVLDY